MSKRPRGYDSSVPYYNWNVNSNSNDSDNEWRSVCGVLLEGIEEDAVKRQRQCRSDPVIQPEEEALSVLVEYSQSIGSDGAYIYEIAARKQNEKIDDGTGVHDVIESMSRANADAAAIYIRRRDEQIAGIQLQDSYYIEAYEKYRAYHYRQEEQSQISVQKAVPCDDGQAQQSVKRRLPQIIPVSVTVQVDNAQRRHNDANADAVEDKHREHDGQHSQSLLHGQLVQDDNSTTLLNRLVWQCAVADCPAALVEMRAPVSNRTLVKHIRRHFSICHAIPTLEHKYALALGQCTISYPPSMHMHACFRCGEEFSSAWAYTDHVDQ